MDYKFKRGFRPEIERIRGVLEEEFPSEIYEDAGKLQINYGALSKVEVWIEEKRLFVTTESNPAASEEAILDTNKRFRDFLEKATGYTAKQRIKQAKKDAQGD